MEKLLQKWQPGQKMEAKTCGIISVSLMWKQSCNFSYILAFYANALAQRADVPVHRVWCKRCHSVSPQLYQYKQLEVTRNFYALHSTLYNNKVSVNLLAQTLLTFGIERIWLSKVVIAQNGRYLTTFTTWRKWWYDTFVVVVNVDDDVVVVVVAILLLFQQSNTHL